MGLLRSDYLPASIAPRLLFSRNHRFFAFLSFPMQKTWREAHAKVLGVQGDLGAAIFLNKVGRAHDPGSDLDPDFQMRLLDGRVFHTLSLYLLHLCLYLLTFPLADHGATSS